MAECKSTTKAIEEKKLANEMTNYQQYTARIVTEKLNEKYARFHSKFRDAIRLDLKNAQNPTLIPKTLLVKELEYVYVTLKRNAEQKEILKLFTKEPEASRFFRRICCV